MGDVSCTDMVGAINYFRRVDPDVVLIRTSQGERLDTVYQRNDDGLWRSLYIDAEWRPTVRGEFSNVPVVSKTELTVGDKLMGIQHADFGPEYRALVFSKRSPVVVDEARAA